MCDFVYDSEGQVHSALAATLSATEIDISPECPALPDQPKLPGQELENYSVHVRSSTELLPPRKRTITFDRVRDVRLFSQDSLTIEYKDFTQVCAKIDKHISELNQQHI